jgi:hypothetical protein
MKLSDTITPNSLTAAIQEADVLYRSTGLIWWVCYDPKRGYVVSSPEGALEAGYAVAYRADGLPALNNTPSIKRRAIARTNRRHQLRPWLQRLHSVLMVLCAVGVVYILFRIFVPALQEALKGNP